jgi:hypothetical protein
VGTLVDHQIVRFGEASLAKFAHKFTLWSHLTAEIVATIVIINSHYRKHFGDVEKSLAMKFSPLSSKLSR